MTIKQSPTNRAIFPENLENRTPPRTKTRIDSILTGIREELERRPAALEGGGLNSLFVQCYFDGEAWRPRTVIVRPEFHSPKAEKV